MLFDPPDRPSGPPAPVGHPALPLLEWPEPAPVVTQEADTGRSRRGWSYYGAFLKCPRKWAYENPEAWGWTGDLKFDEPGGARGLGHVIHALLARHYLLKMGKRQPSVAAVLELNRHLLTERRFKDRNGVVHVTTVQEQLDLARDRYTGYVTNWAKEGLTPMHVEEEFAVGFRLNPDGSIDMVPEGTPGSILFTKRSDLIARDRTGSVWDFDHKSAATVSRGTSRAYGVHGQFHGAWWVGRAHFGPKFAGPRINYVQTWKGRKYKRERPPAAPAMVEGFPRLIIGVASMIKLWSSICKKPSDWPTTANETVCGGRYGMCEHEARCRLGA